ncbi:14 kDa phosphohistidine phosphatase isoform X2 [Chiloscyllium plagiosum]|uniref:14 kDa phosphohistidine phosphatase isoform X2 n=1 Tax=Chiloscyllium plagiosum TaxID=36176 RepID=UPI001CB8391C|nr:14 kDa phosphohistidine phosphatase isoform X2 [Chiloscyllium plagiosum]
MAGLSAVADVQIDPDGVFKYILVRVSRRGGSEHKDIVRGTKTAEFHNNIFEKLAPEMEKLELECKCLGGGKIDHNSKEKKIRVFGVSTVSYLLQFLRHNERVLGKQITPSLWKN